LNKDGTTITTKGRAAVSEDTTGENLPWFPPTFEEALGNEFVKADGTKISKNDLKGKYLGIYFSAHWCGPCRGFTPKLSEWYKKDLSKKNFEIIFVSSDRDQGAFDGYLNEMPWVALPFADRQRKSMLSDMFDVEGIPTFAIVSPDGKVINTDGRAAVSGDPTGKEFPWYPKPVNDLSNGGGAINDLPSLVLMMEKLSTEKQQEATAALESIAKPLYEKSKNNGKDVDMAFFTCTKSGGLTDRLREMTKVGDASADKIQLVLMDIPDNGGYYVYNEDVSDVNKAIAQFYEFYRAGALERQQLG
jgi:nucleoredoxin